MLNIKKMFLKLLTPTTQTYTTSSLNHLVSCTITVERIGKYGNLYIAARNTSTNLAVGSDATCKIDNFPNLYGGSRGIGWSGSSGMIGAVTANGTVTIRPIGSQWVSNYDTGITVPVIFK